MKVRKVSPLLLLLAPSLVCSASDDTFVRYRENLIKKDDGQGKEAPVGRYRTDLIRNDDTREKAAEHEAVVDRTTTSSRPSQQTSRPYRGTEDAPVDGLDGKPHAGPFVDTRPEEDGRGRESAKPTSLDRFATSQDDRWRLEDIPERNDGVMNDEYRIAPKKGTTGTEGGISEKEKLRKESGYAENRPQEPKEAPPSPYSEQQLMEEDAYEKASSSRRSTYSGGLTHPDDFPDHEPSHRPYPSPNEFAKRDGEPEEGWLRDTMPSTVPPEPSWTDHFKLPSFSVSDEDGGWHEWFHSFVLSLTMILFSEIGDKTFLVAALMAMRHNQILVFTAAFGALIVMTVLSAVLGHAVPTLLPKRLTTFAAALLFLVFGAKMLREGLAMPSEAGVGEEMKEVEAELEEKEHSMSLSLSQSRRRSSLTPYTLESGRGRPVHQHDQHKLPNGEPSPPASRTPSPAKRKGRLGGLMNLLGLVLSPAWVQTFVMTFLGEWGDRSQIATIAMAAGQDYWWVTLGAILGHACCTGLAVIGGRALAGRVSMRVVTIGGAVAFLVFGVIYLFECIFD